MGRTALELIGQSGLGYSFDPLTEDGVPHPYGIAAKRLAYVQFLRNTIRRNFRDADNPYKASFIQDGILSNLFDVYMLEDWNPQVPTICYGSLALEESP